MGRFSRLKALLGNQPASNPNYTDKWSEGHESYRDSNFDASKIDYAKGYPQFNEFLGNVRDEIIEDRMPRYIQSMRTKDLPAGSRSEPSILDQATEPKTEALQEFLHKLHNRNAFINDSKNTIDRNDLGLKIADEYVQATHPEMITNRGRTINQYRNSNFFDIPDAEVNELTQYQKKIAKEIYNTDKEPKKFSNNPFLSRLFGAYGKYNRKNDEIEIDSPFDFATPVHEYGHFLDKHGSSSSEKNVKENLANSDKLADQIVRINHGHLNDKLKEQQENDNLWLTAAPGETAAMYNKIKELVGEE